MGPLSDISLEVIEETEVPGLLDVLDDFGPVMYTGEPTPEVMDLLMYAHPLFKDRRVSPVPVLPSQEGKVDESIAFMFPSLTREEDKLTEWLDWILRRKPKPTIGPQYSTDIVLFDLHCPHIEGASSTFSLDGTKDTACSFNLGLAGSGYGRGRELSIAISNAATVEHHCLRVMCPAVLEDVVLSSKDGESTWQNIVSIDYEHRKTIMDLPKDEDPCFSLDRGEAMDFGAGSTPHEVKATLATDSSLTETFSFIEGKEYKASIGAAVHGVSVGVGRSYTFEQTHKLSVILPSGYHYVGFQPFDCLNIFWSSNGWPAGQQGTPES